MGLSKDVLYLLSFLLTTLVRPRRSCSFIKAVSFSAFSFVNPADGNAGKYFKSFLLNIPLLLFLAVFLVSDVFLKKFLVFFLDFAFIVSA